MHIARIGQIICYFDNILISIYVTAHGYLSLWRIETQYLDAYIHIV
jgi:hypothetical protein